MIGECWGYLGKHWVSICRESVGTWPKGLQGTSEESVGVLLGIARELQRNWKESASDV